MKLQKIASAIKTRILLTVRALLFFIMPIWHDETAMTSMRFDLFGVILMALAIGLGGIVGNAVAGWLGLAGGMIGTFVAGLVVYVLYAVLRGMPLRLMGGIIFAVLVWLANMLAGAVQGWIGVTGSLIGLLIEAFILSFIWGNFGASMAGQSTSTTKTKKRRKS
jgi:hypothetical protein